MDSPRVGLAKQDVRSVESPQLAMTCSLSKMARASLRRVDDELVDRVRQRDLFVELRLPVHF